jgi:hypothetical protein
MSSVLYDEEQTSSADIEDNIWISSDLQDCLRRSVMTDLWF